jgi:hypothetical protein
MRGGRLGAGAVGLDRVTAMIACREAGLDGRLRLLALLSGIQIRLHGDRKGTGRGLPTALATPLTTRQVLPDACASKGRQCTVAGVLRAALRPTAEEADVTGSPPVRGEPALGGVVGVGAWQPPEDTRPMDLDLDDDKAV